MTTSRVVHTEADAERFVDLRADALAIPAAAFIPPCCAQQHLDRLPSPTWQVTIPPTGDAAPIAILVS